MSISLWQLMWLLPPMGIVAFIYSKWTQNSPLPWVACARMLLQLLAIGYGLQFLFDQGNWLWASAIMTFMLICAAHIASRHQAPLNLKGYFFLIISLTLGCVPVLLYLIHFVLDRLTPVELRVLIPLAGMVFANAMNALSLGSERYVRERQNELGHKKARAMALTSGMIPAWNSFLAVGLVSLPGMMTGQILAGVDPFLAVRYQILIMALTLSGSGFTLMIWLQLTGKVYRDKTDSAARSPLCSASS